MRHRIMLPPELGDEFSVQRARALGVGRRRHESADLARPFHGVRAARVPETFQARVACYLPRLRTGQQFAGRTALRLWRLPVPWFWRESEALEVVVRTGSTPPRTAGVRGRRLAAGRAGVWRIGSTPVVDPVAALFMVAGGLTHEQTVVLVDALITHADNYPDLVPGRPVFTVRQLTDRLDEWGPFAGCATMRAALHDSREHVESPKETETRLLIVGSGLPEPVVQHEVREGHRLVARVDLAYPDLKIAIEYEGDGHRTDKKLWRADIRRQRELEDRGWIVIRLTQDDLGHGRDALIARIRNAISSRG